MDATVFQNLVERAKSDPAFFHALIFSPQQVIGQLGQLDRAAIGALIGQNPEALLAGALGVGQASGAAGTNSGVAAHGTNPAAPGMGAFDPAASAPATTVFPAARARENCGNTCTESCDYTCGAQSCGHTTGVIGDVRTQVVNPALPRMAPADPAATGLGPSRPWGPDDLSCGKTCSGTCGDTCTLTDNTIDDLRTTSVNPAVPGRTPGDPAATGPAAGFSLGRANLMCHGSCSSTCSSTCGGDTCASTGYAESSLRTSPADPAVPSRTPGAAAATGLAGSQFPGMQQLQCGHTCTESCDYTCGGQSCGHTTGLAGALQAPIVNPALPRLQPVDPAVTGMPGSQFPGMQQLQCGHTCTESCDYTCGGQSCGHTTGLVGNLQSPIVNPAIPRLTPVDPAVGGPAASLFPRMQEIKCGHTCTESCDYTCGGQSCGHTTGVVGDLATPVINPGTP